MNTNKNSGHVWYKKEGKIGKELKQCWLLVDVVLCCGGGEYFTFAPLKKTGHFWAL